MFANSRVARSHEVVELNFQARLKSIKAALKLQKAALIKPMILRHLNQSKIQDLIELLGIAFVELAEEGELDACRYALTLDKSLPNDPAMALLDSKNLEEIFTYDDFKAFRYAAQKGHLKICKLILKSLGEHHTHNILAARNYYAFLHSFAEGNLETASWLVQVARNYESKFNTGPEDDSLKLAQSMIRHNNDEALFLAQLNQNQQAIDAFLELIGCDNPENKEVLLTKHQEKIAAIMNEVRSLETDSSSFTISHSNPEPGSDGSSDLLKGETCHSIENTSALELFGIGNTKTARGPTGSSL